MNRVGLLTQTRDDESENDGGAGVWGNSDVYVSASILRLMIWIGHELKKKRNDHPGWWEYH